MANWPRKTAFEDLKQIRCGLIAATGALERIATGYCISETRAMVPIIALPALRLVAGCGRELET